MCREVCYSLCNVSMAAGSSNMHWCPSLIVNLVYAGTTLQKEGHHFHAAIYTGLCTSTTKNLIIQMFTINKVISQDSR